MFEFPLDGEKKFDYRARVSYNSFAHGYKNRKRENKKKKTIWHFQHKEEYLESVKILKRHLPTFVDPKIEKAVDLWDFYNKIGFDYKASKWLK